MVWYCILYNICFYKQVLKILKPQVRNLTQSSEFIYKNSSTLCIVSGLYVFALRGLDGQLIICHIQLKILNILKITITYQNLKSFIFQNCMHNLLFFFFQRILIFQKDYNSKFKIGQNHLSLFFNTHVSFKMQNSRFENKIICGINFSFEKKMIHVSVFSIMLYFFLVITYSLEVNEAFLFILRLPYIEIEIIFPKA